VELSQAEEAIVKRIRRAKFFVFLRRHRHELFSVEFQSELATIYKDSEFGQPPIPPAQLALATILQAYTGDSDDWAIENTVMDRRWQMVLDCHDCSEPLFSKGTLVTFRRLLIEHDLDRRLIERTVELAAKTGEFGARQLRGALDSSPLWGAGRVEDTYNLLGHALRKALGVIARQQGRGLAEVAGEVGSDILAGSSLKAALDLNWDEPDARQEALQVVLTALDAVESWLTHQDDVPQPVRSAVAVAEAVKSQDVEFSSDGKPTLRKGVAKDRRISVEDAEMRHGRKSRSQRFDGYKRHILRDLDTGMVRAVGLTRANSPEASVTDDLLADLEHQNAQLSEIHLDRAYLSSNLVRQRGSDLAVYCKAWPVRNGDRFPKTAFELDWERETINCPSGCAIPFVPGGTVHFPEVTCQSCSQRERCTTSHRGRSVSIHPDERLLCELRQRQLTPAGRQKLRERVEVEHSLAHIGAWQGDRARYLGQRKNLFDLRRTAVVHNLHVVSRSPTDAAPTVTT
jgi:transposase